VSGTPSEKRLSKCHRKIKNAHIGSSNYILRHSERQTSDLLDWVRCYHGV